MQEDLIPSGSSEAEVLSVIENVAGRLAGKFKFGYHDIDDMKQQARMFAWQGLEKYDNKRPLENFLWTHVRNRLYNYKRDNYARLEKPCDSCPLYDASFRNSRGYGCKGYDNENDCSLLRAWKTRNKAKMSLMHGLYMEYDIENKQEGALNALSTKEIFKLIDAELGVDFREDWIRYTNSLKLPKNRKDKLIEEIKHVLEALDIDPKTW